MQEFDITHFWMLGVMFIMVVFLGAALFGHFNSQSHQTHKVSSQR